MKASLEAQGTTVGVILDLKKKKCSRWTLTEVSWVICKVSGTFFSFSSHPLCTSSGLVPESPSLVVAASLFSGARKQCLFCITIASFLHWTVRACFLHPGLLLSPSFFSCIPGSAVRDLRWRRQAPLLPLLSIQEQCRAVL